MFCTKCGNQIPDDSAFCINCGQKIGDANNAQMPATTPITASGNNLGDFLKTKKTIVVIAVAAVLVVLFAGVLISCMSNAVINDVVEKNYSGASNSDSGSNYNSSPGYGSSSSSSSGSGIHNMREFNEAREDGTLDEKLHGSKSSSSPPRNIREWNEAHNN